MPGRQGFLSAGLLYPYFLAKRRLPSVNNACRPAYEASLPIAAQSNRRKMMRLANFFQQQVLPFA